MYVKLCCWLGSSYWMICSVRSIFYPLETDMNSEDYKQYLINGLLQYICPTNMSTVAGLRNKQLSDKENPPHPGIGLKKLNSTEEAPVKKIVLGDSSHTVIEEEPETETIGGRLMLRKRESQKSSKQAVEFVLRPIQC